MTTGLATTLAPIDVSDDALVEFAVIVVLVFTTVAFGAYAWTWLAARRR